jgi:hypothetical protein
MNRRRAASVILANVVAGVAFAPRVSASVAPSETLEARLSAIQDRPMPLAAETDPCGCSRCTALRGQSFHCECCGYTGVPFVNPCCCDLDRLRSISLLPEMIADETSPTVRESLERKLRECETSSVIPACEDGDYGHFGVECPVCINDKDQGNCWTDERNAGHPWAIIRDVRAALGGAQ